MTKVYALNISGTTLQLKNGYVEIRRGAYRKLTEEEQTHPDFQYALEKGWISLHENEPTSTDSQPTIEPIVQHEAYKGMTSEELKAEQAKPVPPKTTSESIGVKPAPVEEAETTTEATVETDADKTEETPVDTAPKTGRNRKNV